MAQNRRTVKNRSKSPQRARSGRLSAASLVVPMRRNRKNVAYNAKNLLGLRLCRTVFAIRLLEEGQRNPSSLAEAPGDAPHRAMTSEQRPIQPVQGGI